MIARSLRRLGAAGTVILAAWPSLGAAATDQHPTIEAISLQLGAKCGTFAELRKWKDHQDGNGTEPAKRPGSGREEGTLKLPACEDIVNPAIDSLNDAAYDLEGSSQWDKAIDARLVQAAITVYADGSPNSQLADIRLQIAGDLEELEDLPAAEEQIRRSIADYVGTSGEKVFQPRARVRLAMNLNRQKRFADAEEVLKTIGVDRLDKVEGMSPEAREALAEAQEGQGRYGEAEAWRRQTYDTDKLVDNLTRQGKRSEAADAYIASQGKEYAESIAASPVATETDRAQRTTFANLLDKSGQHEEAEKIRRSEALPPRTDPTGVAHGTKLLGILSQPGFVVADEIRLATLLYNAGRFEDVDANLSLLCLASMRADMLDINIDPSVAHSVAVANDSLGVMTTENCYRMLALAKARRSKSRPDPIDDQEFAAAQYATLSPAGAALNHASARAFAVSTGFASQLDRLDRDTRKVLSKSENFWTAIPADKLVEQLSASLEKTSAYLVQMAKHPQPGQVEVDRIETEIGDIQKRYPKYFELRAPPAVAKAVLQGVAGGAPGLLQSDEALVLWMYVPGEEHGLVYAVSRAGSARVIMKRSGAEIDARVKAIRDRIDPCGYGQSQADCGPRGSGFDRQASWELYDTLLGAPEIQKIIGSDGIKTLLIVPSGPLTSLPPAILLTQPPEEDVQFDEDPGWMRQADWLIRSKAIAVLPGVSTLETTRESRTSQVDPGADKLFMFADPDFSGKGDAEPECSNANGGLQRSASLSVVSGTGDAARAKLPPLPCTRLEGERMKRILGGEVLLGGDAREARLRAPDDKARLANAQIVAFATHGLVTGENGLNEPALALAAPRADERDDGFLTASGVLSLNLSADWVILSACNTASPDSATADGLSGLSRAFFAAGAKSVLVSHWRVDDLATMALTGRAVALRQQGFSKAEAIRRASLELLQGKLGVQDGSEAFPAAWGPFTLMGDPH